MRFATKRSNSGWIVRSLVATMYQLGLAFHAVPSAFCLVIERRGRGIALTPAGRVFLDHARLALMQIEVACEAARGTEQPQKPVVIGFFLGQEAVWLSESLRILREEAPEVEITLMTKSSPELADG